MSSERSKQGKGQQARTKAGNRSAHGGHPVLTMCASNAVTAKDPAGNRKLDKHKATGRIDGMVALAMAFGAVPAEVSEGASFWETEAA